MRSSITPIIDPFSNRFLPSEEDWTHYYYNDARTGGDTSNFWTLLLRKAYPGPEIFTPHHTIFRRVMLVQCYSDRRNTTKIFVALRRVER